jgi:hypothetical protein
MWERDILEVFLLKVQYRNSISCHPEADLSQSTPATLASATLAPAAIAQAFINSQSLFSQNLGGN